MARHGGEGGRTPDIFVKCGYFYVVLISPVFQDGRRWRFLKFALVSILFLFQILIFYIN